jgi:transcriptional regulator with XRE-family HTH domain
MLKEYRERIKLSQEKLEEITNIDRKTIFRIENDLNIPLLDTFAKLVTALNLSDKEIAKEVKNVLKKK